MLFDAWNVTTTPIFTFVSHRFAHREPGGLIEMFEPFDFLE